MADKLPSFDDFAASFKTNVGGDDASAALAYLFQGGGAAYEAPPAEGEKGLLSDTGTALKSGWFELGASARGVGRALLPEAVFDAIDSLDGAGTPEERDARWQQKAQEITSGFSPEAAAAREKMWFRSDEDIEKGVGSAWLDPRAYWLGLMESIPGTVATMGPTAALGRRAAVAGFERFLASDAGKAIAAKEGLQAAQIAAQTAGGKAAQSTALWAGGILEGAQQGGSSAEQVRAEIAKMSPMQLQASEAYRALLDEGMTPEEAVKSLKNDVGTQTFWAAGIATGIFGGRGDAMLQKAIGGTLSKTLKGRIVRGAIEEGLLEEAPQGFFSKVGENIAMQRVDPTRGTFEGAVNEALGGAAVGGIMGGGMATIFGRGAPPDVDPPPPVITGLPPDQAGAALREWSAQKTANVAAEMSRILQQKVAESDLVATEQEAQLRAQMARGRGMAATIEPIAPVAPTGYEAFEKETGVSLGTYPSELDARRAFAGDERVDVRPVAGVEPTQGFMVNRQQIPGSETQEAPSFEFPTEGAARALGTSGPRETILSPGGFSSRATDPVATARNLTQLAETSAKNIAYLRDVAETITDPVQKALVLARAKDMESAQFEAAPDPEGGAYVRAYAETVGTEVQFVNVVSGPRFQGRVIEANGRRVLYLDAKSKSPMLQVAAHEVVHRLKTQYADLYEAAKAELVPLFTAEARAAMERKYAASGLSVSGIEEELMADFFATQSTDKAAIRALAKKNPTVWGRVAQRIIEILDSIIAMFESGRAIPINKDMVSDLKKARQVYVDTMAEFGQRVADERAQMTANEAAAAQEAQEQQVPAQTGEAQPQPGTTVEGLPMMSEHHAARQPRDAEGKFVEGKPSAGEIRADQGRDAGEGAVGGAGEAAGGADLQRPAEAGAATRDAQRADFTEGKIAGILSLDGWAIITAENPDNTQASNEENTKRTNELRQRLRDDGLKYIEVRGRYSEEDRPEERSFIIFAEKETAMLLGADFGQESILTREGLVYQDGSITPATGTVNVFETKPENYYTRIPGQKWAFSVDLNFDERIAAGEAPLESAAANAFELPEPGRPTESSALAMIRSRPAATKKTLKVEDVGRIIDRFVATRGGPFDFNNPEHFEAAVSMAVQEVRYQLGQANSGLDWYEEDIAEAFRRTERLLTTLRDNPVRRQLFSILAGVLSPSVVARDNWNIAARAFEHYEDTGVIPSTNPDNGNLWQGGLGSGTKRDQLNMLNAMVQDMTEAGAVEWLMSSHTVEELNAARVRYGGFGPTGVSGKRTDSRPGLTVFGEKVGPFVANINGIHEVTVDVWMIRTFMRYFGTMFRADGKMVAAPSEPERRAAKELARRVRDEINANKPRGLRTDLKDYQVQSLLWFFEQQFYAHIGAASRSTGFADGAAYYAEQRSKRTEPAGEGARPRARNAARRARPAEAETLSLPAEGGPAESAVRPGREGSVGGIGVHFGNTGKLPALSGNRFGSGIRGAEQERLTGADPRIRRRVYFYLAKEGEQFNVKRREYGLGTHVYRAELSNLYEPGVSPNIPRTPVESYPGIVDQGETSNRWEVAVLDAGYDGYLIRNPDIAVVLNKDVKVKYLGQLGQGQFAIPGQLDSIAPDDGKFTLGEVLVDKAVGGSRAIWDAAAARGRQQREAQADAEAQIVWLTAKAEALGSTLDDIAIKRPEVFAQLAAQWRAENPRAFPAPEMLDSIGGWEEVPPPKKSIRAYKLFKLKVSKKGQIFALYVGAKRPIPIGQWIKAEPGELTESGKVQSSLGELAYRPGFHSSDLPRATHIGGRPVNGKPTLRKPDQVWAEIEVADDRDWQAEADKRGARAADKHITDGLPEGGFYRYKTNASMEGEWIISGEMRVVKLLTDEEVASVNREAGVEDLPREAPLNLKRYGHAEQEAAGGMLDSIPGFYSALEREVERATMKSAPASAWLSFLRNRPGIKPEDFEWTGAGELLTLRGNEKVTKDELLTWIATRSNTLNDVEINENVSPPWPDNMWIAEDDSGGYVLYVDGRFHTESSDELTLIEIGDEINRRDSPLANPEYEKWTLPGGVDYTELLITVPAAGKKITVGDVKRTAIQWVQDEFDLRGDSFADNQQIVDAMKDDIFAWTDIWEQGVANKLGLQWGPGMFRVLPRGETEVIPVDTRQFKSSHFEAKNIVAHLRFKARADNQGRRVMFIEEIQSDWAQKGKREGFGGQAVTLTIEHRPENGAWGAYAVVADNGQRKMDMAYLSTESAAQRWIDTQGTGMVKQGIPAGPFVQKTEAWVGLAIKRAILWSLEHDFDAIAWTTGEQQAERYELSKVVKSIEWTDDGAYNVVVRTDTGVHSDSSKTYSNARELEEMFGKELATKIVKGEGTQYRTPNGYLARKIEGLDLNVGGSGMRQFYDMIVPKVAKDVLRKLKGPAVETVQFHDGNVKVTPTTRQGETIFMVTGGDTIADVFQTREEAEAFADRRRSRARRETVAEQQGFVIPEEWKKNPIEVPIFAEGPGEMRDLVAEPELAALESSVGPLVNEERTFDLRRPALEQFLIFSRLVAGKMAGQRAPLTVRLINELVPQWGDSPFEAIRAMNADPAEQSADKEVKAKWKTDSAAEAWSKEMRERSKTMPKEPGFKGEARGPLLQMISKYGLAPWQDNVPFFKYIAENDIDVSAASVDELSKIPGISHKTARFFAMHTRQNAGEIAVLDVHVLRWLRDNGHADAPAQTPTSVSQYSKWEKVFTEEARARNITNSELDMEIWLSGRVNVKSEAPALSEVDDDYPSLEGIESTSITDLIATVRSDLARQPELDDRVVERLGRDWLAIGKRSELFRYHGSNDTDLENVAYDMGGRSVRVHKEKVTDLDMAILGEAQIDGEPFEPVERYRLDLQLTREQQLEMGHRVVPAYVYVDQYDRVAMNIQAFQAGVTNGNLIYQIVATWAHNNDLIFIGDPAGLSEAAIFRRAENMFVNALRTGTTQHLYPHPYQVAAGLEWRDGNPEFNVGALALFSKRTLDLYRNELTREGSPSKHPDAALVAIPAGRRTAARAAMTTELLTRIENDLPGIEGGAPLPKLDVEKPLYAVDVTYEGIRNTVFDMMRSEKNATFWDRTVGTQLHKARRFPAFGKVYALVQKFMNDTSLMANAAAEKAPEILRQMDHWGDIIPAIRDAINPQSRRDRAAASKFLLDGRVNDRVYTEEDIVRMGGTPRQYKLYRQMRNAINTSLDQLAVSDLHRITRNLGLDEARARIMGMPTDRAASLLLETMDRLPKTDALEFVRKEVIEKARRIQHLKATGYAPLMRFGRFTIEYEIDGERAFNMFETEGDRNRFERELRKAGAIVKRTGMMSTEAHKLYRGFDPAALEVFGQMTTLEFYDEQGNVRKASISETEMFQQFLRQATANHSALRRLIKAKKVPGYSEDGSRILASFVTSNARMASRNLNMQDMIKAASIADGPDKRDGDIKDEAIKLVKYVQDGQEEAQALRGLLFINYLGGSVASALVNMSQPLMMSWPQLSRWGAARAAGALSRAFRQAVSRRAPGGRLGADLLLAQEQGIVSPQEIHHLQAEASRTLGSNPILRAGLMAWGSLFSAAEQFNRRATFIAAWEIGNELGQAELSRLGYDSVYDFAVAQTVETQGTYNRGNRPNWARGAVGATVFTFKQYSIHYLEWLQRLPKWQKVHALAILMFVSGINGLPFADDLDDLIDALAQNMGYAWNTKDQKRQFLTSVMGKELANFIMSGASTLPGVPIDVQGRLSMGNLLPGSSLLKPTSSIKDALEILGPAGGVVDAYTTGAKSVLSGQPFEALMGFSPVAVKNFLKGADMVQTGAYRDSAGRKVVDATYMDAVAKTIGFMPPAAAEAGRRERSVQEIVDVVRRNQTNISRKWAEGIFTQNPELVEEARDDLRQWNLRNPETRIKLDFKSIQKRVQEMRKTRSERMRGNAPKTARDLVRLRLED